MRTTRFILIALPLALPLVAAGCAAGNNIPYVNAATPGAESPPTSHPAAVVILEGQADVPSFAPMVVRIPVGGTVKWSWRDPGVAMNVTFPHFHSATMTGGSFYHRFDSPGTYHYQNTLFYQMTGTVIVGS